MRTKKEKKDALERNFFMLLLFCLVSFFVCSYFAGITESSVARGWLANGTALSVILFIVGMVGVIVSKKRRR